MSLFLAFAFRGRPAIAETPRPLATAPIGEFDSLLHADLRVGDSDRRFVLDSGCAGLAIARRVKPVAIEDSRIGVRDSANKRVETQLVVAPAIRFQKAIFPADSRAIWIDLRQISEVVGYRIDGFLGVPFLRRHVVQVDFDRGVWSVFEAGIEPQPAWGRPAEVTYSRRGLPQISLSIAGDEPELFTLDSGMNSAISLASSRFTPLVKRGDIEVGSVIPTRSLSGVHEYRSGRVSSCDLLGYQQSSVCLHEANKRSAIGLEFLRRFQVTFDLGRDRVYFAPSESFEDPWRCYDTSIGISGLEGRYEVGWIRRYSAAASSGLRKGDRFVSIDDVEVQSWPLGRLRKVLREAEEDLRLTVDRRGETLVFTLPRGQGIDRPRPLAPLEDLPPRESSRAE